MFHPGSVRFRPRSLLSVIVLFVIGLSVVPGHVQASGPVLDKLNPAESKIGIISAQNPEYRYEITARAGDEVLAGLIGDEDFSPALEIHTGSAGKPGSPLALRLPHPKSMASL